MIYGQPCAVHYGTDDEYRAHWLADTENGCGSYVTTTSFQAFSVTDGLRLVGRPDVTMLVSR